MFYPLFLDLRGRRVLVIGGGAVAERKIEALLDAEADITVVAPEASPRIQAWAQATRLRWLSRRFEPQDVDGVLLAFSATGEPQTQEQAASAARARKVPINTVDVPQLCDFIVPAVVRRDDITVAISTSGKSPALAGALRARIEEVVTADDARAARLLGEVRAEVHARIASPARRKDAFEAVVRSGVLEGLGSCDDAEALARIRRSLEDFCT